MTIIHAENIRYQEIITKNADVYRRHSPCQWDRRLFAIEETYEFLTVEECEKLENEFQKYLQNNSVEGEI